MDWKALAKKTWWFLWEDTSGWSWVANIIVAFVLIKFLVYPGLSLAFGTTHPIVAVVSGSMEHQGKSFDTWWTEGDACCKAGACFSRQEIYNEYGIDKNEFDSFRFRNGFNKGDLMVLVGEDKYEIGDVLVFWSGSLDEPIIHRVIKTQEVGTVDYASTKGDNNCGQAPFEKQIAKGQFIGKAVLRIPYLGWIKLAFVSLLSTIRGVFV